MFSETLGTHGIHIFDTFEFENGRILENVEIEYFTYGVPKYDDEGHISNAVIIFPTSEYRYSLLINSDQYIKNHGGFSEKDFYFIRITPLGMPNSCSPSTTNLKYNFPKYTLLDIVNFKRKLLKEKFEIEHVLALVGETIGGYEIFTWACEYPDEMDSIFILNSSYKNSGYRYVITKCFDNMIDSIDEYYSDVYSPSFSKAIIAINTLILAQYLSKKALNRLNNQELDALLYVFNDEELFKDIHDFKLQTECFLEYEIDKNKLKNIKARSVLIGNNKNFFDYELDILPLQDLIENSTVITHESESENYYFVEDDYNTLGKELIKFLESLLN